MTKTTTLFRVDVALFGLLAVTILTVMPDTFSHCMIHVAMGILLSLGALLLVVLHWNWIKNAAQRFDRLPDQARSNFLLNLYRSPTDFCETVM